MAVAADYTAVAEQLYIAYFGRPADRAGLANMTANLAAAGAPTDINELAAASRTNATVKDILTNFGTSAESQALYGTGSDASFIVAIYHNVLNRDPLLTGLDYWTEALATGAMTRAEAASQILAAAVKDGGNAADAAVVNNKTTVAENFTAAIDTAAEVVGYNGKAAAQSARDMLASVDGSTDPIAFNSTVNATLATIVAANTPGQVFTLTTGPDTWVGGAGNDTFNALPSGATNAATFTLLDSIDGGAGTNTLNITNIGAVDLSSATGYTVKNVQNANLISTATVKGDFSSWTGLTNLSVSEVGGNAAGNLTAAATTNVTVIDGNLTTGSINVVGGNNVAVTASGASGTGTVTVGSAATAGTITATVTDADPAGTNTTTQAITTNGGTSVKVTHNITAATSATGAAGAGAGTAYTTTAGDITVNGTAVTTNVTVTQTAEVAAVGGITAVTGVTGVVAATETGAVTFAAGGLANGASLTIGGLTVTAAGGALSGANLAAIFASLTDGATAGNAGATGATFSGTLTGFSTGAAAGSVVTFTSATANTNVADLTYTNSSAITSVVETQGKAAVTAVTAVAGVTAVGGIDAGAVIVNDTKNTITSVTLDGFGAGSKINGSALTTLSLANSENDVVITDSATTPTATTLAVTVNNLDAALTDNTVKTLNLTASGAASALNVTGSAVTTVSVAGDKKLDLTGSTLAAVTSFTSTNSAGVTVSLNQGSTGTFGAGADVVTVAAGATKAIALGAGDDTAIVTTLGTGGSVDGGAGVNTLSIAAVSANTASQNNTFAQAVKNFQKLVLTGSAYTTSVDVAVLGGYTDISAAGATALTLNNTASGATLTLTGAGTAYTVNQTNANAGTADVLNLKLTGATSATQGTVTAGGVEIVNITTTDSSTKPAGTVLDTLTLAGNDAITVKVSGTAALALTAGSTALTSFDASGLTVAGAGKVGTGVNWVSGALASAATIKGSVNGGDFIDASLATKAVTITETAGTNTIKGSSTIASTLTGGTGADTIWGGAGKDVIVGGGGADIIHAGAGADSITVSGGKNTIVQALNDSGSNTSTITATSALTSTFDVVKGVVAGDKIDLSAFLVGSGVGGTIGTGDLVLAATNLAGVAGKVEFAAGTFDATNGVFAYGSAGADTVVTFDHGSGNYESIVLVGYHAGATTAATGGIITLG